MATPKWIWVERIFFPFPLKLFPSPKFRVDIKQKCSGRKCFVLPMKLNFKGSRKFPPPTRNPWNGCSGYRRHTKSRLNHHDTNSAPRVDLLFSSSASTGGSTDSIDHRGFYARKLYSTRLDSRSNKDENKNQQMMMKMKDAQLPRMRKNKFPVAVPWISPLSNSWHFPRSPAPNRTEAECLLCQMKNFSGRRNGRAPTWRRRIQSIFAWL